jgi:hypothetical protein
VKDVAGKWALEGIEATEKVDESSVSAFVNRVVSVSMLRPLGQEEEPAYGLAQPQAVVTVETRTADTGDRDYVLLVGTEGADANSYIVKSSESPYYVEVARFAVEDVVKKSRTDFLQLPSTPSAVPEAAGTRAP